MEAETLSRNALNRALLARQFLLKRTETSAAVIIEHLMGLQAQQVQPPFIGLWTRVANFEPDLLLNLLREREIVRCTLMRGTLHLVSGGDCVAFRNTFQPMLTRGVHSVLRDRAKDLDIRALVATARESLREGPKTFTQLRAALVSAMPNVDERAMGYMVRMSLPLVSVPDGSKWGYRADSDFADAETWLGQTLTMTEQFDALVLRYLASFGPAAAVDFQAWSGLSGAKAIFDKLRPSLRTFRDGRKRELFDLPEASRPSEEISVPIRFLPGFDNVILAHADRSRIIADEYRPRVTTKNLLVSPTFLLDGFVAGTWKIARVKDIASLEVLAFEPLIASAKEQLAEEGEALVRFVEPDAKKVNLRFMGA